MSTDVSLCPPAWRSRVVEPVPRTTRQQRRALLERAGFNPFRLPARFVSIDLLTDSGTGAISAAQLAAMMQGDEAYAGSSSFERFEAAVREVTGYPHVLPTHQGRAAERLLFSLLVREGDVVPGNGHFDTTSAHLRALGAEPVDLPVPVALDPQDRSPFKGDIDLGRLRELLRSEGRRVPFVLLTLTNNRYGGHPVSLDNVRQVAALCAEHGVALWLDVARFAENAALAIERDPALRGQSPAEVARRYFELASGCTMSAKKDGLAPIGGFVALRDAALAERLRPRLIRDEGFPTYGGLAGHDLEVLAVGLREALEPAYLRGRLGLVAALHERLERLGVPLVHPPGGHAVFVDAGRFFDHVPPECFPGQTLVAALYEVGGIRACELGRLAFGPRVRLDLVRLAIPRRVYGLEHVEYVARVFEAVAAERHRWRGLRLVSAPRELPHFSARLQPVRTR